MAAVWDTFMKKIFSQLQAALCGTFIKNFSHNYKKIFSHNYKKNFSHNFFLSWYNIKMVRVIIDFSEKKDHKKNNL